MSYEVTGKLIAVYDTMQRTETFKVREFVIEKQDDIGGRIISNFIKFQCVQDKTEMPGRFNVGDEVKVSFNLKGNRSDRSGQTTYFTNLDAWRMENAEPCSRVAETTSKAVVTNKARAATSRLLKTKARMTTWRMYLMICRFKPHPPAPLHPLGREGCLCGSYTTVMHQRVQAI